MNINNLLFLYVQYLIFQLVQDHNDIFLILHLIIDILSELFHDYPKVFLIHFQMFLIFVHVQNNLHLNIDDLFHMYENLVEFDEDDLYLYLIHLFFLLNVVLLFDFLFLIVKFDHVLLINHFLIVHNQIEDVLLIDLMFQFHVDDLLIFYFVHHITYLFDLNFVYNHFPRTKINKQTCDFILNIIIL